jgi:hypothetical protein
MESVGYMERTRSFYAAQGYEKPYRWAHFEEVPFAALRKPLAECTVGLVGTASLLRPDGRPELPKRVYSASTVEPPASFYTDDLAWDKEATHIEDIDSFLPLHRLQELAAVGRISRLAPHFYGVPAEYSQRRTIEADAPEVLRRCREDGVDVALLVPL